MNNHSAFNEFRELMEYRQQSSSVYVPLRIPVIYRVSNNQESSIQRHYVVEQYNNNMSTQSYSESSQLCHLSLAAVKFREIPFYEPLHILLHPSFPIPNPSCDCPMQESSFSFRLSPKEVRDVACNHECQILMRFCKFEIGTEQNDYFPPDLAVKVNGKLLPLEVAVANLTKKPLLITQFAKILSTVSNDVNVSWSSSDNQLYAFTVYIAKPISSFSLLQKLKDHAVKKSHFTTSMVIEKIKEGQDLDIAIASIQASLLCPLGKSKMEYPCRASTCTHIACFDASMYIQLQRNKDKWKWQCPICDKLALYKNLEIDELFKSIISKVPRACTEVQFFGDGSWAPIMPVLTPKEVPQYLHETSKSVEIIDISSDSDTDDQITVD